MSTNNNQSNSGWHPRPHVRYTLGDYAPGVVKPGQQKYRYVFITISRDAQGIPQAQRVELPEDEARRMVRIMSSDLW